jgi:hypothetical protein
VANSERGSARPSLHDDDEDLDDTIFIPLGLTKAKAKTYYKGSDPEWQEFRKLAPDHKKHIRMRGTDYPIYEDSRARTDACSQINSFPSFGLK